MFLLTSTILVLGALSEAHVLPRLQPHSPTCLDNVTAAFEKAHIVPDVLPSFSPRIGIDALFMDPVTDQDVKVVPGILLTTEREFFQPVILAKVEKIKPAHPETDQPPQWSLSSHDKNLASSKSTWVVTIVDPDALTPQNPSIAQFLHFIGQGFVVDHSKVLKGVENSVQLTNVSSALVEFFHPSPPAGSDPHRYVILVYVQPDNFEETGLAYFNGTIPPGTSFRQHFNITDFAAKTALGNPVAGNFFLVGPDVDF